MDIMTGKICPYCGKESEYVDSIVIYGRSYGMIYLCKPCDAYVGTHKSAPDIALGRLANKELREAKKQAHFFFDQLWTNKYFDRKSAYEWLCKEMNLHRDLCHIGMFNVEQCNQVVTVSKEFLCHQI